MFKIKVVYTFTKFNDNFYNRSCIGSRLWRKVQLHLSVEKYTKIVVHTYVDTHNIFSCENTCQLIQLKISKVVMNGNRILGRLGESTRFV